MQYCDDDKYRYNYWESTQVKSNDIHSKSIEQLPWVNEVINVNNYSTE